VIFSAIGVIDKMERTQKIATELREKIAGARGEWENRRED
jgi:hypothetical protein